MTDRLKKVEVDPNLVIEMHPLVYAREYVQAEDDFDKLAGKKLGDFDLATVREIRLQLLIERTGGWWRKRGDTFVPSNLHLEAICYGFSKFSRQLEMWIEKCIEENTRIENNLLPVL